MIALYVFTGFIMTIISILVGYLFGYQAGYKSEKTLKQQIGKLKTTIRKQGESKQLRELTARELQERDNWDMRTKLAELTGNPITAQFDSQVNDDPASMERTF